VVDRVQGRERDSQAGPELNREEGRQGRAQGAEPDAEPVLRRLFDGRIDGLENQGVDRQGRIGEKGRRSSQRGADGRHRLAREAAADEVHGRAGIPALQVSEGDSFAGTFAVSLEVEEEDRVPRTAE
jgi:hypothetical protein